MVALGIWYIDNDDHYTLQQVYGCAACKVIRTRLLSENDYYYLQADGSVIMRPTFVALKSEKRLPICNYDPGFDVV
jgi:hypothetical protein